MSSSTFHQRYTRGKILGRGAGGAVYIYVRNDDGKAFATKEIDVAAYSNVNDSLELAEREVRRAPGCSRTDVLRLPPNPGPQAMLMVKVDEHPNIVRVEEIYEDPTSQLLYIVMELVAGVDLSKEVRARYHATPQKCGPRACSWTIGRAGVTAACRQFEEADIWSYIAQVPLPAVSLPLATHLDCAHGREHEWRRRWLERWCISRRTPFCTATSSQRTCC